MSVLLQAKLASLVYLFWITSFVIKNVFPSSYRIIWFEFWHRYIEVTLPLQVPMNNKCTDLAVKNFIKNDIFDKTNFCLQLNNTRLQ